jgi:MFS family permease
MLMANGPAIIAATFPSNERGTALGTLSMVVSAGLFSGPVLGGYLIEYLGWRSIFFVNIPIGILGIILVGKFLIKDLFTRLIGPFDWAGLFLQTVVLMLFIVIFDPPNISVSGSIPFQISRWIWAVVTLIFGAIFIKVESDAKAPLFDLALLKSRTFWTANLASFLTFVAYSSVTVLMPFFLEEVMKFNPTKAGLFMTAIPITIFVIAPISGRLSDRFGSQELSFLGAMIGTLGLFMMSRGNGLSSSSTHVGILFGLASIGMATGLFQSPNNNAIMGAVPLNKLGVASAFLATIRNLGLVTGTGLTTSIFTWRMNLSEQDFVSSLHFTQRTACMVGVAAMCAALGKPRTRPMAMMQAARAAENAREGTGAGG